MDKIITGEHSNPYLPNFLAGDRLLLMVHGEVIGGVDLSRIQPSEVAVQGRKVSLHLPPPRSSARSLIAARLGSIRGIPGYFLLPIPTWKVKSGWKGSASFNRRLYGRHVAIGGAERTKHDCEPAQESRGRSARFHASPFPLLAIAIQFLQRLIIGSPGEVSAVSNRSASTILGFFLFQVFEYSS
jgi:hypothetical protein